MWSCLNLKVTKQILKPYKSEWNTHWDFMSEETTLKKSRGLELKRTKNSMV